MLQTADIEANDVSSADSSNETEKVSVCKQGREVHVTFRVIPEDVQDF
jgi:hypothetical protein